MVNLSSLLRHWQTLETVSYTVLSDCLRLLCSDWR